MKRYTFDPMVEGDVRIELKGEYIKAADIDAGALEYARQLVCREAAELQRVISELRHLGDPHNNLLDEYGKVEKHIARLAELLEAVKVTNGMGACDQCGKMFAELPVTNHGRDAGEWFFCSDNCAKHWHDARQP